MAKKAILVLSLLGSIALVVFFCWRLTDVSPHRGASSVLKLTTPKESK